MLTRIRFKDAAQSIDCAVVGAAYFGQTSGNFQFIRCVSLVNYVGTSEGSVLA